VRTQYTENGLDFVNLKDPKVRQLAVKNEIRDHDLKRDAAHVRSHDSAVEHSAHAGTVEIGGADAEAYDPARKTSITTMT
jgi:hypothetical protein